METLSNLSNALTKTVESGDQSVVRVEARRRLPASGIVWSPDGVIVTAHHIVKRDDDIRVGLPDGKVVPAKLMGRDRTTDLAVLRAEAVGLITPAWADGASLRVGHLVLALGRPGKRVMATLGIVSALDENWRTPVGGQIDRYLQTDVVMYPGFSGGLLLNAEGKGLGLNTSALLRGVSMSIPYPTLQRVVEALLAHGRVRRGYLGVGGQPVRLPGELTKELDQETGILLVSVDPDSPAGRGGLVLGDTIITFNNKPIRHLDDLLELLSEEVVGVEVPLQILRGGQIQELMIVVGERD
ncbi:MAG: trypsin-like peptidase domain-containing protein [Anaerolineaceae bacterium]|nr:MAG: trypsin-like peptidase domain-containing protein [Anaerolineaceae bacterium]